MIREYKDCLTNEQLLKRFTSQFDLVRYAIDIATREIQIGRDAVGYADTDNIAFQVLSDIAANREILREVPPKKEPVFEAKKPEREEKKEKKAKVRAFRHEA